MSSVEWTPPTNAEAERALVGSILHDAGSFADARMIVTADDFYEPRCALLWQLCETVVSEGLPLDLVALAPRTLGLITDGAVFAAECMESVMDGTRAASYARLVSECSRRRNIGHAALRMLKLSGDPHIEGQQAIEQAQAAAMEALREVSSHRIRAAPEIVDSAVAEADAAQVTDGTAVGLRTGWGDLDLALGGLRAGDMLVVAARPSQGKSSFATSLLGNVAVRRSMPSLLVTLETSPEQVVRNIACAMAGVNAASIMAGTASEQDYTGFMVSMGAIKQSPLHVLGDAVRASVLRAMLPRLVVRLGLRLVVVDYLQFLTPEQRGRETSREREVATMSWHLKQAAKEAGIPLVVLCQLNRAVESRADGKPKLSDLRDSGSIEQDADTVLLLSTADSAETAGGVRVDRKLVQVAKNRVGPTGDVSMHFARPWLRWGNDEPRLDLVFVQPAEPEAPRFRRF